MPSPCTRGFGEGGGLLDLGVCIKGYHHRLVARAVRREDDRAFEVIQQRMTAVDTRAHEEEWVEAALETLVLAGGSAAVPLLLKLMSNIAAQPEEPKFRKVRLGAPRHRAPTVT